MNPSALPRRTRGQNLIEFSLTIPILLMIIILALDPFFFAFNLAIAKYYSFYAARAASIYLFDGSNNCLEEAEEAADIGGAPQIFNLVSGTWGLNMSANCNADALPTPVGEVVTATITFQMSTIWWGGTWTGTMATSNVFQ